MTEDFPVDVHTHIRYKDLYQELDNFRDIAPNGDYELSIDGLEKYASDRFFSDLKPFWEFDIEEVTDEEDSRYPSDRWLASIYEVGRSISFKEAMKHGGILLEQLREAWYFGDDENIFYFDEETKVLTAYTSGWSGCEDIVYVLRKAFPWVDGVHANLIFDMRYFFPKEVKE